LRGSNRLGSLVYRIGFFGDTHADDAFSMPSHRAITQHAVDLHLRHSYRGDETRDWNLCDGELVVFPYDRDHRLLEQSRLSDQFIEHFWPWRTLLWRRGAGNNKDYLTTGKKWWQWHQLPRDTEAHPWAIPFAFVTTHNHFVLDRDGNAFNRSAPVIKLPESASEEDHLYLLGLLNSSTACFWLKMVSHNKGSTVDSKGA